MLSVKCSLDVGVECSLPCAYRFVLEQGEKAEKKHGSVDTGDEDKERKPRRKAYVHKPFLYSRYYSDSDDEITVEERRRSAVC